MESDSEDDWLLVSAWRDGDRHMGDRLAMRYFDLLMRFFLNKVRDVDDATELVGETFLGCTAGLPRVVERGSFRSYLFAIAMNKLRGYYRRQAKRQRELDDFVEICVDAALGCSPLSVLADSQETRLLVDALRRLTLAQQIVVELYYFEGLKGAAIAELLGVTRSTVVTHLRRSRTRLRELLTELSDDPALAESTLVGLETWMGRIQSNIAQT